MAFSCHPKRNLSMANVNLFAEIRWIADFSESFPLSLAALEPGSRVTGSSRTRELNQVIEQNPATKSESEIQATIRST